MLTRLETEWRFVTVILFQSGRVFWLLLLEAVKTFGFSGRLVILDAWESHSADRRGLMWRGCKDDWEKIPFFQRLGAAEKTTRKQSSLHLWCVWHFTIYRVFLIILHLRLDKPVSHFTVKYRDKETCPKSRSYFSVDVQVLSPVQCLQLWIPLTYIKD